jgi:hypothetical protein
MGEMLGLNDFDGVWRMLREDSMVRDPVTGEWVPEVIEEQVVDIRHEGPVVDCRVRIHHAADLVLYLKYTCRYDADEWVPYVVHHIDGDPNHESLRPNNFRTVQARVGEPIAYLKQIYVDPRTHYRITRHPDGAAQYSLMSRLSEDGERMVAVVHAVESEAAIVKHVIRDRSATFVWP